MYSKKIKVVLSILLLSTLLAAGFFALAAEYGSQEDPLVTLSYITDVVSPGVLKEVDAKIAEKLNGFNAQLSDKIKEYSAEMDEKLASGQSSAGASDELVNAIAEKVLKKLQENGAGTVSAADWKLVDFAGGKTMKMSVGTEVLLRIGSAKVVSSGTPGLINLTSASEANNGSDILKNNLYIVTIDGRGLKAAANCKILVRGAYTIS
ncbi:MAG: hypothetical protein Q8878_03300 [Bacillota bacterium]|nr:hypothetical protein [Bacillota bacterium]